MDILALESPDMAASINLSTGFAKKEIPDWVWGLSKEYKKEFIKGLFDADGYARSKRNRSKITSCSIKLLQQIQLYLNTHGINTVIAIQCGRTYCISISGHSDKAFYNFLYNNSTVYLERKYEKLRLASMRK